jgi:hypothetical protein
MKRIAIIKNIFAFLIKGMTGNNFFWVNDQVRNFILILRFSVAKLFKSFPRLECRG